MYRQFYQCVSNRIVVSSAVHIELVKKPSRWRLWRLSFSAAEKAIFSDFAGGAETCRKDVLRLLKTDLLEFYADPTATRDEDSPRVFCSYYLKMLVLHLYDRFPSNDDWEKGTMLLPRYVDALMYWQLVLLER